MTAGGAGMRDHDLQSDLRLAVRAEAAPLFAELRHFVDRRVAELSAELHASVQLADMTEERLSRELALVQEKIAGLVAVPATSARSSGVELEAIVQATESAANTILEAAEAIQGWIASGESGPEGLARLSGQVNSIFEACSFQDVTGQRIRRAIQHLQQVESVLERFLPAAPRRPRVEVRTQLQTVATPAGAPDLAQAEIDALLNGQGVTTVGADAPRV